jgi:hypothetical protein
MFLKYSEISSANPKMHDTSSTLISPYLTREPRLYQQEENRFCADPDKKYFKAATDAT